jgi:hypothetical protein
MEASSSPAPILPDKAHDKKRYICMTMPVSCPFTYGARLHDPKHITQNWLLSPYIHVDSGNNWIARSFLPDPSRRLPLPDRRGSRRKVKADDGNFIPAG